MITADAVTWTCGATKRLADLHYLEVDDSFPFVEKIVEVAALILLHTYNPERCEIRDSLTFLSGHLPDEELLDLYEQYRDYPSFTVAHGILN